MSATKDRKENASPDASERLQPEREKSRHFNHRNNHDFHRRRHHRRANKRGRRNHRPRDWSPNLDSSDKSSSGHHHRSSHSSSHHRRPPATSKHLVLRPTKGPLLNAPKNSTQFIIDDHETSPLLDPMETGEDDGGASSTSPKKYNTRSRQASSSSSRRVSASEEAVETNNSSNRSNEVRSPDKTASDCQATPGNYVVNDDDYTLWAEFSERDFQSVYESAHQQTVADWDRSRLIEEITNLEKRQKELVDVLAKVDPEMYAQRLQNQLAALQEKNRLLRNANGLSPSGQEVLVMDHESGKSPHKSPDSSTKD